MHNLAFMGGDALVYKQATTKETSVLVILEYALKSPWDFVLVCILM